MDWQTGNPPNEVIVEVETFEGEIRRDLMAFYGRDGTLPHWRTHDGRERAEVAYVKRWRPLPQS